MKLPAARQAQRTIQEVEIWKCPTTRMSQMAEQVRRSGADVPPSMRPVSMGKFRVATPRTRVRESVMAKVEEQAKLHKCLVRSLSQKRGGWVAYLALKEKTDGSKSNT